MQEKKLPKALAKQMEQKAAEQGEGFPDQQQSGEDLAEKQKRIQRINENQQKPASRLVNRLFLNMS